MRLRGYSAGSVFVLVTLWSASASAQQTDEQGWFVDRRGSERAFAPTYADWSSERYVPHYGRAAIEITGLLGIAVGWYWLHSDQNSEDWDYPSAKDRFLTLEAVTFDNNDFVGNYLHHGIAGTTYYLLSRVNGLGPYGSLGFSFIGAALNEWAVEANENISLNDMIYTPFGTWASGEFFFQLGDYLNSAPAGGGWGNQLAAMTLGLPRYVHDRLDDPPSPPPLPTDNLGLSSAYWHRFGLAYGVAGVDNDESQSDLVHDVLLEAELVRMPGFLRPGEFSTGFDDGNFVEMRSRLSFDERGWADVDLWFSADIAGHYEQALEAAEGGVSGSAWSAALNTAVRYIDRSVLGREDQLGVAHLFGPSVRAWLGAGELLARMSAAAHLDFAGVRSLAYEDWSARFGPEGTKSILQKQSYQFSLGASASGSAALELYGTELGVRAGYGRYESIEGLDREQDDVIHDIHGTESMFELAGWLGHTPPEAPIHVRVSAEQRNRWSSMSPVSHERWDRRIAVALGARF